MLSDTRRAVSHLDYCRNPKKMRFMCLKHHRTYFHFPVPLRRRLLLLCLLTLHQWALSDPCYRPWCRHCLSIWFIRLNPQPFYSWPIKQQLPYDDLLRVRPHWSCNLLTNEGNPRTAHANLSRRNLSAQTKIKVTVTNDWKEQLCQTVSHQEPSQRRNYSMTNVNAPYFQINDLNLLCIFSHIFCISNQEKSNNLYTSINGEKQVYWSQDQ